MHTHTHVPTYKYKNTLICIFSQKPSISHFGIKWKIMKKLRTHWLCWAIKSKRITITITTTTKQLSPTKSSLMNDALIDLFATANNTHARTTLQLCVLIYMHTYKCVYVCVIIYLYMPLSWKPCSCEAHTDRFDVAELHTNTWAWTKHLAYTHTQIYAYNSKYVC